APRSGTPGRRCWRNPWRGEPMTQESAALDAATRELTALDTTALNPRHRAWSLGRMVSEVFDVVVVGGGVTGTGAALDAATRGLSVALIEARDYAAGASSKSSKLIHGGLRYLELLDFALVREALRERRLLLTELAPHLVRPVPFLWPLTHRGWERPYVGAGLLLYDSIGGRRGGARAPHPSPAGALRGPPPRPPGAPFGGGGVFRGPGGGRRQRGRPGEAR